MAGTRAAIRYAKAILDLAQTQKTAEAINEDMMLVSKSVSENQDLSDMLQSPMITSSDKKEALLAVFPKTNPMFSSLVDLLVTNKRVNILGDIASKYVELFEKAQNIEVANVTTAVPLSENLKKKVLAKVKELTSADKIEIKNTVDESILGGFILRVGDIQYNASIANQLNKLKREFTLN
ncbi:ATP synthase F1 subcomplex delta subunit [Formosa sp. Hel1_31_208]|uniref:ATP synthase F1 subunit delta n=1 Tax=Formosa sp. Hel1_31_208 TaxID=1798225 RepID=UPI00087CE9C0|nr:ATP synthase F1 subunit delta [Formosa sp. Hel1_31_208]SDR76255.1 ATP synthase F1 subcomplex delta subunit [Formosa sp. Hel1_31_208]